MYAPSALIDPPLWHQLYPIADYAVSPAGRWERYSTRSSPLLGRDEVAVAAFLAVEFR